MHAYLASSGMHACVADEGTKKRNRMRRLGGLPDLLVNDASKMTEETESRAPSVRRQCAAVVGRRIVKSVDAGHTKGVVMALRALADVRAERTTARIMEAIILGLDRPDVAAKLLLRLLDEGKQDLMIFAATATARRAEPEVLLRVFMWLTSSRRTVDAASLALVLTRHGEAQIVADLEIGMIEKGRLQDARDMVAVLLAQGHAAEVVQVSLCIVRAGHAEAVAQMKVSLVDSGGLALACEAQHAMVALDELALAEISNVLVRMGREDVAARMIILLVDSGQVGVVCKWLEGLDRHEGREALLQLSLAIGRMKRSDVDAAIKVSMVASGKLDMAKRCMVDVIKKCHPWVTAAIKVEMVRQGHAKEVAQMAVDLSKEYEDSAPTEAYVLLLRGGHAEVWAAIIHEIIKMKNVDVVARRTGLIIQSGRPNLAGEGMRVLAGIASPKAVVEAIQSMVELGEEEAAAQLLADLAQRALTLACEIVGAAGTAASLLLRLLDGGNVAAMAAINNCIIESGNIKAATTLASALAAQTDVLNLMETLKAAGARILPSVWQRETSRYVSSISPSLATRIAVTTQGPVIPQHTSANDEMEPRM
ncbi:hypothetical protein COCOBI_14-4590 [Coccomyxa sp. Obi]|nr:hypothetical protein COCOBI_14-4590 [Coccomyxa sp. Obi]